MCKLSQDISVIINCMSAENLRPNLTYKFCFSIVQLYEYGIPLLYEKLEETGNQTSVTYTELEGYIDTARAELIDIFREILAAYKSAIFSGE